MMPAHKWLSRDSIGDEVRCYAEIAEDMECDMRFPLPTAGMDLSGQTALVTGATSGLGYRFAKVLALAGAQVAVAGRRQDRLQSVVSEIREAGGTAFALSLDVADAQSLSGAVAEAERELGLITILINNAGMPDAQLATKMPLELIDQVLNVNLRGPFVLAREVAARLILAKQPGRIVNIASMAAFNYAIKGSSLYSITKSAVVRMTEVLAVEWASAHINVNCIAPGSFDTEMLDGMRSRIGDTFIEQFPRKRLGDPAQLDSTLLYLVSSTSDAVTGTVIRVDDGQLPR
ncbi:SDR family NAD(P)-dependent oxidoreductase [Sphingobium sp. HBC34]|uniref:SDR family NAD(P)-dependent oxidoreductase n=1 Tax=Sphingobium cyanobacteriorum TaxID=3063954 RepID=A0ABT8ZPG5_9SPHN|nr:SDR family NAD(P)-dependent oxidoreductase [Sphingobium sp. HBC34]MDO7836427.1 SDR family NAD(P)-dependent oxidoreductase [Sphingobium sp. HBC34]